MSSKHRLTRSFRTLSALLYILNIVVSVRFTRTLGYLDVLVGSLVSVACLIMLFVAIEAPTPVVTRLERSRIGENLFTFRGRYIMDLLVSLFLFAMGVYGVIMGICTLVLIFGIRFLGVKQPDAFNEIFRQSDFDANNSATDSYTLEDTYDTEANSR
ncbi:unnamed protein product [Cylindrotheca closterium]|uniref:Uncharacterized protein n=1 Tax=Cylindrotheca closterium TaxID=2856 RepID=A0AAD2FEW5_9STRA|nr:unnamed protein product [Cylindrotheca closterium]